MRHKASSGYWMSVASYPDTVITNPISAQEHALLEDVSVNEGSKTIHVVEFVHS